MAADAEGYEDQVRFDEALAGLGLDLGGFGPDVATLEDALARHGVRVRGFGLEAVR
jgi:hypothetical protein